MTYVKHMGILSHVYADMEIDYANAVTLTSSETYIAPNAGVYYAKGHSTNSGSASIIVRAVKGDVPAITNQAIVTEGSYDLHASVVVGKGDSCSMIASRCNNLVIRFYPFK